MATQHDHYDPRDRTDTFDTRRQLNVRQPYSRELGGFELSPEDARKHPAACPDDVMERMREAALKLGLSIKVGARRPQARLLGRPRDGTWERYIVVTDDRLPAWVREQETILDASETWANAARRIGLWPTR